MGNAVGNGPIDRVLGHIASGPEVIVLTRILSTRWREVAPLCFDGKLTNNVG